LDGKDDAMVTEFATGLGLGESPRWHEGRLWVCDWVAGEVLTFDPDGTRSVHRRVRGFPFSLDWLPDGRTVLTGPSGVVVADGPGPATPYGAAGEALNEIVVDPRGNVFVNAPGFDLMAGEEPRAGSIGVVTPDGAFRRVAGDVWFPNGMAVTPDGSILIVAESYGRCLTAFDVAADGSLSGRRTWAALGEGTPDGICLAPDGTLWYADVPHRRCVRVREGGEVLDVVDVDQGCFSCVLGGPDRGTLFITAATWTGTAGIGADRTGRILARPA
jgi:sugar lactone lactonase YvrE